MRKLWHSILLAVLILALCTAAYLFGWVSSASPAGVSQIRGTSVAFVIGCRATGDGLRFTFGHCYASVCA